MGVVYRATDTKLGRQVAIKLLPEIFARDPERLSRFEREARMLASLNHPNIAAIHGLEESHEMHCLVLELVPGKSLNKQLASGSLPIDKALAICRQIAEDDRGIIHRDLKPSNVMVTREGKVKVLDVFSNQLSLRSTATPSDSTSDDLAQRAFGPSDSVLRIAGSPYADLDGRRWKQFESQGVPLAETSVERYEGITMTNGESGKIGVRP